MTENNEIKIMEEIGSIVNEGKIDDAVKIIAKYLNLSTEENYIDRLENVIEKLSSLVGGRVVIRFLIENLIIDIPSLLENLSKKDSLLRYSFLLLLKNICENESDLFLPYSENLLNSEDPNVKEADLQLLIFMAGGEKKIDQESLIKVIALKLTDEKDFVVQKAIQALKAIGKEAPSIVTRVITEHVKENSDDLELKKIGDRIIKSIVSVEKLEEIVEEEVYEQKPIKEEGMIEGEALKTVIDKDLKKEEEEIKEKERELIIEDMELKKQKFELEMKEKELVKKEIIEKEKVLKIKEKLIEKLTLEKAIDKDLIKEEKEMKEKERVLIKKDLELKKKKLELDVKEKELVKKEIIEKEKALKIKEELIEKDSKLAELAKVELELKKKKIKDKEKQIIEEEAKRVEEKLTSADDNREEGYKL